MAKENETTTKFKVDISELVNGMAQAKRQIALANAEFKSATAGMDNWAKSADGINAKLTQLDKTLGSQKSILNDLEKQYELTAQQMGADSKEAENLKIKIENQKASIGNTEKQIRNYNQVLEDLENEAQATGGDIDDLADSAQDAGRSAEESAGGFTVMKGALANLVADGIRKAVDGLKDFAKSSIQVGSDFEASMSEVSAISGATGKDFELLEDTAKKFGASTVFSASESAQALKYMALAGWDAQTSSEALGGVLALASASGMDLAKASDMVTDYLSAFNMKADQSTYFADMLAFAQSKANTSAEQLGEAYKNCAASLNASGQDVETVTSLLSMMANQGFKGSEAGTALTAIMRDMTAKMADGKIAIGETAVTVMNANGNYRDMTDILKDVEKATNGMGDAERATALSTTFTADSTKGLNLLLNAGIGTAEDFEKALRGAGGTAEDMGETMNDNLTGDIKQAQSALEDLQITAYDELQPALREIVQYATSNIIPMIKNDVIPVVKDEIIPAIKEFISWIVDNKDAVIAGIAGIGAGFVAWNVATMIQGVVGAIKAFKLANEGATVSQILFNAVLKANPIVLIVSLIIGLITAIATFIATNDEARAKFEEIWGKIKDFFIMVWEQYLKPALTAMGEFFKAVFETIKTIWETYLKPVFESIKTKFIEIWDNYLKPALIALGQKFSEIFNAIKKVWETVLKPVFEAILSVYMKIWEFGLKVALIAMASLFAVVWKGIEALWNSVLKPVFQALGDFFKYVWDNVLKPTLGFLKDTFSTVFNFIKEVWDDILKPVFEAIGDKFKEIWNKYLSPTIESIKDAFQTMSDVISKIWDNLWNKILKPVINSILGGVEGLANGILKGLNVVIGALNNLSFDIPDWVPEFGGKKFGLNIGKLSEVVLPRLAKGGIVDHATRAVIGEAGKEAVIPLERNTGWLDEVASRIVDKGGLTGAQTQTVNNNYNYEYNQTNNSPKALSRLEIYRQTRNQFNYAVGGAI